MLLSIIITPLVIFLCLALYGRFVGHKGAAVIAPSFMRGNAFFSFIVFYQVGILGHYSYHCLGTWIDYRSFVVDWAFMLDSLTVTMLLVVNLVSALVHIYSISYMEKDSQFTPFMSYSSLFTFLVSTLIISAKFLYSGG